MSESKQVREFREAQAKYERFRENLHELVKRLCDQIGVDAQVESRTKSLSSFESKINRPGKNYSNPLNEITDLVGVRIIANTLNDVDLVVEKLRSEFLIDQENSVNKAEILDADRFGYLSQHLIIELSKHRTTLFEWKEFESIRAEIQVRTALQHTWSVVQHPLDYKSVSSIPRELRRRLFRLSALFELADNELDQVMVEARQIRSKYRETDDNSLLDLPINQESLEIYIKESSHFKYWDEVINSIPGLKTEKPNWKSRDVDMAVLCGLKTLQDFEDILKSNVGWWEEYSSRYFQGSSSLTQNGILLYSLIANFPEILTKELLKNSFGFGMPDKAINLAYELNPKFRADDKP